MIPSTVALLSVLLSSSGVVTTGNGVTPRNVEIFVAGTLGAGWTQVKHPGLSGSFWAPSYSVQAGLGLSSKFVVGVEMSGVSHAVRREQGGAFQLEAASVTGAECTTCRAASHASYVLGSVVSFTTMAVRLDFSPLGRTGPYLAALGGLGVLDGLPADVLASSPLGSALGAHAGFRYRFTQVLEALAELTVQAQFFSGASVTTLAASGLVRLYL